MKTTTSKPVETKSAKDANKKSTTETKATPVLKEASVTIINETDKTKTSTSLEPSHELIAETAYFLWETEGYKHGLHDEYWLRAEYQLKQKKN